MTQSNIFNMMQEINTSESIPNEIEHDNIIVISDSISNIL